MNNWIFEHLQFQIGGLFHLWEQGFTPLIIGLYRISLIGVNYISWIKSEAIKCHYIKGKVWERVLFTNTSCKIYVVNKGQSFLYSIWFPFNEWLFYYYLSTYSCIGFFK